MTPATQFRTAFLGRWLWSGALLLALTGVLCLTPPVQEFDRRVQDSFLRLQRSSGPSSSVALVLIDDSSLRQVGRWPWSRSTLAALVRDVSRQQPRVIGLDILLSEPQSEATDAELASAIHAAGNVVLVDKISSSDAASLWVEPLPRFASTSAAVGHAQAILDPDGICRRFPLAEMSLDGVRNAFSIEVASRTNPALTHQWVVRQTRTSESRGAATGAPLEALTPVLAQIPYRPQAKDGKSAFVTVTAADLMKGANVPELRDKIVLVGFGATELHDRLATPLGGEQLTPGIEIHAHIVDAILSQRAVVGVWAPWQIAIVAALCMFATLVATRFSGWAGALAAIGITSLTCGGAFILYSMSGKSIHAGPLLCAAVLAYPVSQFTRMLAIERAVGQQLRGIQKALIPSAKIGADTRQPGDATGDVNWKLDLLRQLQTTLASAYEFEHTLLETTHDHIAVFRADGEMSFCNSGFLAFWQAAHGDKSPKLADFDAWLQESGWHGKLAGAAIEDEVLLDRNLWGLRVTPLSGGAAGEPAIMVVLSDLRTRMERDQARAEALGFVTHELRTPLVSIQGFAELMMRFPDSGRQKESSEVIYRESRRLVSLINGYLDVLRLDSGARSLNVQIATASSIANQVIKVLQPLADSAGIEIVNDAAASQATLECDAPLIVGALMNLASNAIKYGEQGGKVRLAVHEDEDSVTFTVWNSGRSIPPEDVPRLFEPYYRGSAESGKKSGWGLGLAFVNRIAAKHGGQVSVSSREGEGTEFRLRIPGKDRQLSIEESAS